MRAADINEATLKSDDFNKKSVGMRRQAGGTLKFPRYHSNCLSRVFGGITEIDNLSTNQGMSFENEENLSLFPQCILEKYDHDDNDDVIAGRQIGCNKN